MSYKILVSKPNYNVLTDTNPDHLIFSSDYNTLKYYVNGSYAMPVNSSSGYYNVTQSITHGLGYKPFFVAYAYWIGYSPVGIFYWPNSDASRYLGVAVDENKMYFTVAGHGGSGGLGIYEQFQADHDQHFVEVVDPSALNQCFDLVVAWTDLLGIPHYPGAASPFPVANACDIYNDFTSWQAQYFEQIPKSDTNYPEIGDIVVWDYSFNGAGGHTGIANGVGDQYSFHCFVQNDPPGGIQNLTSPCHLKQYGYSHVLGWLRTLEGLPAEPTASSFTAYFKYKLFKNNLGI